MASITIRRLDERTKQELRQRAARHGRSMEEEARRILREALAPAAQPEHVADLIRREFAPLGGVALPEVPRERLREPPDFAASESPPAET